MKRIWPIFIFLCSTAVLLAACSGSQVADEVILAGEVETAVDPAPAADEAELVSDPIDTTDLTLIGETGRPQFLNAYASW